MLHIESEVDLTEPLLDNTLSKTQKRHSQIASQLTSLHTITLPVVDLMFLLDIILNKNIKDDASVSDYEITADDDTYVQTDPITSVKPNCTICCNNNSLIGSNLNLREIFKKISIEFIFIKLIHMMSDDTISYDQFKH